MDATPVTITVNGPGVGDVVDGAVTLYDAVLAGRWSAVVDLMPDRFADPVEAAKIFESVGAGADGERRESTLTLIDTNPDLVVVEGARTELTAAVDLYQRVWVGQFDEIAFCAGAWRMSGDRTLTAVRLSTQASGAWPDHPSASWSIRSPEVPDEARVAYNIWKVLGGGVADRPQLHGTGLVTVHIDG